MECRGMDGRTLDWLTERRTSWRIRLKAQLNSNLVLGGVLVVLNAEGATGDEEQASNEVDEEFLAEKIIEIIRKKG